MPGTHFTEQQIREALDGTFTRIPDCRAPRMPKEAAAKRKPAAHQEPQRLRGAAWNDDDDLVVICMLRQRYTHAGIAAHLGRGIKTISARVRELRDAGRVD